MDLKVRKDGLHKNDLFNFMWHQMGYLSHGGSYFGICAYISFQAELLRSYDFAHKVWFWSQTPDATVGALLHVVPHFGVCVNAYRHQNKCDKKFQMIGRWGRGIEAQRMFFRLGISSVCHQKVPSHGTLIKGFHFMIEIWWGFWDEEGWKLSNPPNQKWGLNYEATVIKMQSWYLHAWCMPSIALAIMQAVDVSI